MPGATLPGRRFCPQIPSHATLHLSQMLPLLRRPVTRDWGPPQRSGTPPPPKLCRLLGKESKNPAKLPFCAVGRRNYSLSVTLEGLSQHASPHQVTGNVPEVRAT